jgi:hypothetical protein
MPVVFHQTVLWRSKYIGPAPAFPPHSHHLLKSFLKLNLRFEPPTDGCGDDSSLPAIRLWSGLSSSLAALFTSACDEPRPTAPQPTTGSSQQSCRRAGMSCETHPAGSISQTVQQHAATAPLKGMHI